MMTKTIETLAALLHSLNPRLLRYPPPAIEVTGHDICYLGPNGEDDLDQVIFCRDLQDDQRPTIGSWYVVGYHSNFVFRMIQSVYTFRMKGTHPPFGPWFVLFLYLLHGAHPT